ncbi:MAG: hypothetical protein ABI680_15940 [Chthoniobacteraceae bacterium]
MRGREQLRHPEKAGRDEKACQDSPGAPYASLAVDGDRMAAGTLFGDEGKELSELVVGGSRTIREWQEMESKTRC